MHLLRRFIPWLTGVAVVASTQSSLLPSKPPTSSPPTIFHVISGSDDNYFYRDNITTAQLLLTNSPPTISTPRRFVTALPAGNNGALVYFLPRNSSQSLNVQLVNGNLQSTTVDSGESRGIHADLQFSGNATFGVTIIGAVRAMRGQ